MDDMDHGMLRRTNSSKKHVVWDEDNLKVNEEIKKEYSNVRIQEPKTPYRPPLPSDSSADEEMNPLRLDEEEVAAALNGSVGMTAFDFVMSNGGADYVPPGPSQRRAAGSSSNASSEADGDKVMTDAVGDKRTEPCNSFTSSEGGSEGPVNGDKRRRFKEMRKQHYNMKDALVRAKRLLASEDEEDEEQEDEEEDTAGWHRQSNGTDADAAAEAGTSSRGPQSGASMDVAPDSTTEAAAAAVQQSVQQDQARQQQQQQPVRPCGPDMACGAGQLPAHSKGS